MKQQIIKNLLLIIFVFVSVLAKAQLPADMSNIKASQITDAQLQQFVQKAAESGMTEMQIEQEFTKRRMPSSEIEILKTRIGALKQNSNSVVSVSTEKPREVVSNATSVLPKSVNNPSSPIFGAELFTGGSTTFAPNLNMPTPKNYILGPSDELNLDISGVNVSQQTLKVSSEGIINVRYAGPMQVNGITVEEATNKIISKLKQYYPAISTGQTKVSITLGNIRTNRIIIIGAVTKPGTYDLPSLASLFNALYVSGGPAENGSFRNIELIRNNRKIAIIDVYDFLLKGDLKNNSRLENNDVIRIPFAEKKITLSGEVNRQGIFELKGNETLANAINFAGGYTVNAYKARITGIKITDFDKRVIDISKDAINSLQPENGDKFLIGSIVDRFENRVIIEGSVFKPGTYALENGMTLAQLIDKAAGLKEDAYTKRIIITRKKEDLVKEYVTVSYNPVSQIDSSIKLIKEDIVQISSIFDIRDQFTVTINGAVRKPSTYNFEDSLSLKTLILQAGGFADNATGNGIEISRRKRDVNPNDPASNIAEIIIINDKKELSNNTLDFQLKPFDIVSVKIDPNYKSQINVAIQGEVLIPGIFTLQSREERISSLIKRAGGILYTANVSGAKLKRKNDLYDVDLKVVQKIAASSAKDSSGVVLETEQKPFYDITIDLPKILTNPGSKEDILLVEGDYVFIPIIDNMVSVSGEVFKPLSISYDANKTLKSYLYDAGGVTNSANKKRTFVIYPNGKAGKIKHPFLFFRKYPKVTAGTKIFVPKEPEKKAADVARVGAIISAVSSLIAAFALAYQITK